MTEIKCAHLYSDMIDTANLNIRGKLNSTQINTSHLTTNSICDTYGNMVTVADIARNHSFSQATVWELQDKVEQLERQIKCISETLQEKHLAWLLEGGDN